MNGEKVRRGGIRDRFGDLASTLANFLQVRAQLLALEVQEASQNIGARLVLYCAAGFLLALGYLMVWCALVPLMARKLEVAWEWVCLWAAIPHFLVGAGLIWWAKEKLSKPLFEATLKELDKDQEWVARNLQSKNKRPS